MPSKSKSKGSSYEREIAKFLSDLYSEPFVRVPNSGAYTGGSNSHRKTFLDGGQAKSFKGDIIAPDLWVNFNSECKNYADFPFHQAITGECKQLDVWLDQLMVAGDPGDLNILFIKINRKGRYVCVQEKLSWDGDNYLLYNSKKYGNWVIFQLENFFNLNSSKVKYLSNPEQSSLAIEPIKV